MAWGRKHTAAQKPAWSQDDYHTAFASKIKEQIEQGVAPWQKPWKPGEQRLPKNIQSDKPYRGGNSVYLSVTQTAKGYSDNRWATYKQIKDMGGQVRKGEKATHVLFYKFDDETAESAGPARPPDHRGEGRAGTHTPADGPLLCRVQRRTGGRLERWNGRATTGSTRPNGKPIRPPSG